MCRLTVAPQTPPAAAQPKKKPADNSSSAPATGGSDNNNNPDRFCSICQASFNNPLMAQQHYVGKKHRKQMTKMKLMETYGPSTTPGQTTQAGDYLCDLKCKIQKFKTRMLESKRLSQVQTTGVSGHRAVHIIPLSVLRSLCCSHHMTGRRL